MNLTYEERLNLLKKNDTVIEVAVPTHDSTLEEYVYIDVMELLRDMEDEIRELYCK